LDHLGVLDLGQDPAAEAHVKRRYFAIAVEADGSVRYCGPYWTKTRATIRAFVLGIEDPNRYVGVAPLPKFRGASGGSAGSHVGSRHRNAPGSPPRAEGSKSYPFRRTG
jgi:hypothetical protein